MSKQISEIISELDETETDRQVWEREALFRRGYDHGFNAALEALNAGATFEDLCAKAEELTDWRNQHLMERPNQNHELITTE